MECLPVVFDSDQEISSQSDDLKFTLRHHVAEFNFGNDSIDIISD